MRKARLAAAGFAVPAVLAAMPLYAQAIGAPISLGEGVSLDPILAARWRYEAVDQAGVPNPAEAVTLRARGGAELKAGGFSLLAEGEGTAALVGDYNDTLPGNGIEPYPIVADPETFELNRLQLSWFKDGTGVTLGRQRIVHDDARFVGNVGWRQNEQTFDAVRGQAELGPVRLDASYAISQRTVFGADSPNAHYDGDLVLLNAALELPLVDGAAFAYLLDYDSRPAFSSQTWGLMARADIPLPGLPVTATVRWATQSDYGANPSRYRADYLGVQLSTALAGFALTAGHERLGSDRGQAAFQAPLATLHAFNGWADLFLTTPASGLRDSYVGLGRAITVPILPGLRADVTYHVFASDFGVIDYGSEWDASLGFKLGTVGLLAKYARYDAAELASDTEKLWLQAEVAF